MQGGQNIFLGMQSGQGPAVFVTRDRSTPRHHGPPKILPETGRISDYEID